MLGFNAPVGARHTTLTTCIVYHAPAEKAREKGKSPGLFNNLSILKIRHWVMAWHIDMMFTSTEDLLNMNLSL